MVMLRAVLLPNVGAQRLCPGIGQSRPGTGGAAANGAPTPGTPGLTGLRFLPTCSGMSPSLACAYALYRSGRVGRNGGRFPTQEFDLGLEIVAHISAANRNRRTAALPPGKAPKCRFTA